MKILHLARFDVGGAAKAMLRLHRALCQQGHDSRILVQQQFHPEEMGVYVFQDTPLSFLKKAKQSLAYRWFYFRKKQLARKYGPLPLPFSLAQSVYSLTGHAFIQWADIIHLHWVAEFVDYPRFFAQVQKPIVWTLHDMHPFTGGEHYSWGALPPNDLYPLLVQKQLQLKRSAIEQAKHLVLVCPSKWIQTQSIASPVFKGLNHYHIPNGIDLAHSSRLSQREAREKWHFPPQSFILIFVSEHLQNPIKGLAHLIEALPKTNTTGLLCLLVGKSEGPLPGFPFQHLEYQPKEQAMAELYAAADVCVVPSLIDNFPNTVLEAMAAGRPVIGYSSGGIGEMIKHQHNGLLVETGNVGALQQAIAHCIHQPEVCQKMGQQARIWVENTCAQEKITFQYQEIYEKLGHNLRPGFNAPLTKALGPDS